MQNLGITLFFFRKIIVDFKSKRWHCFSNIIWRIFKKQFWGQAGNKVIVVFYGKGDEGRNKNSGEENGKEVIRIVEPGGCLAHAVLWDVLPSSVCLTNS